MNLNQDIVPSNLEEAIQILIKSMSKKELDLIKNMNITELHFNIGRTIRNEWSLWDESSVLVKWFYKKYGVSHADDVSSLILECLIADLNNKPRQDKELAERFIEHWETHKRKLNKKE